MGQAQGNGGRAILGNGGGTVRPPRVVGLLHTKGLVGVQAALAVGTDSTKHLETTDGVQ